MNQEEQPRQNISMAVDAYGAITFWGFSPTTALNNLQKDESPNSMYNFTSLVFRDNVHSHLRHAKRPMAVRGGGGGGVGV